MPSTHRGLDGSDAATGCGPVEESRRGGVSTTPSSANLPGDERSRPREPLASASINGKKRSEPAGAISSSYSRTSFIELTRLARTSCRATVFPTLRSFDIALRSGPFLLSSLFPSSLFSFASLPAPLSMLFPFSIALARKSRDKLLCRLDVLERNDPRAHPSAHFSRPLSPPPP